MDQKIFSSKEEVRVIEIRVTESLLYFNSFILPTKKQLTHFFTLI